MQLTLRQSNSELSWLLLYYLPLCRHELPTFEEKELAEDGSSFNDSFIESIGPF